MRGKRNTDRNVRKFITITDTDLWDKIDKIMTLPKYKKSFNKVINDALDYGLPELCKSLFEPAELESITLPQATNRTDRLSEQYFAETIKLLKELIINVTLNKSVLCSLFNAKSSEYNGQAVSGVKFSDGAYRDTPAYLEDYELRALRDLRR